MRNKITFMMATAFLVVVLFASFGFGAQRNIVEAQDDQIVCDWTLITLLYISEHEYGHFPMTDVSNFDFGQYTPLFEAMMAEMEMTATEEPEMSETEEPEMSETEEPEMSETEEPPFTFLEHGDIEGEPQACTDLRHELDAWFLGHFMHEMEMDE
jgi:hypothetical protein